MRTYCDRGCCPIPMTFGTICTFGQSTPKTSVSVLSLMVPDSRILKTVSPNQDMFIEERLAELCCEKGDIVYDSFSASVSASTAPSSSNMVISWMTAPKTSFLAVFPGEFRRRFFLDGVGCAVCREYFLSRRHEFRLSRLQGRAGSRE